MVLNLCPTLTPTLIDSDEDRFALGWMCEGGEWGDGEGAESEGHAQ